MRTIALIGMPGSGKSTVGRHLARRLGVNFVDSDAVIEHRLGHSIRQFFEREGEAAFRDLEESVIDEIVHGPGCVLATGGGVVLRPGNRARLHEHCSVIYLQSTPTELFRRLRNDRQRPLLQVADPLAKLRELYGQRDPLYREAAHFTVETGRPSVPTLVNMILMQIELGGCLEDAAPQPGQPGTH